MIKNLLNITLLISIICVLSGCKPYDPDSIIGLNSIQIIEKYGEFDNVSMPKSSDGLYRNCSCGYIVSQANKGFLGTTPAQVFMIYFDDDGLAYKCAYETGGKGG